MRFIGRGTPADDFNTLTADVVLQPGQAKVPPKAEKLLGTSVRIRRKLSRDKHTSDEDQAIAALSRMRETLANAPHGPGSGWPWGPDCYNNPPNSDPPNGHPIPGHFHREPYDANLPAYYDAVEEPYHNPLQMSAFSTHNPSLRRPARAAPDTFDDFGEPAAAAAAARHSARPDMKQHELDRRSKTAGHSTPRPRKLDLVQLFPQPRPPTGRVLSPSRVSSTPSATMHRVDSPVPPLPPKVSSAGFRRSNTMGTSASSLRPSSGSSGVARRKKEFEEDIFDQHKTNVRRPPKGIQNWFDAYLDSDEEEDAEEGEETKGKGTNQPEPQELPADEVLPPAYSASNPGTSPTSNKSADKTRCLDPVLDSRHPAERHMEQEELALYNESDTNSWDSIQSSHLGVLRLRASDERLGSALSLSSSAYEDDEEPAHLPTIRDSILDDRNIILASASSVGVRKLSRPQLSESVRGVSNDSAQSSASTPAMQRREQPLPVTLQQVQESSMRPTEGQAALHHVHGSSLELKATKGSDTEQQDLPAIGLGQPSDAAHMIAVTEEEMILLDLMRRKRAAMQQLSFTEGYQLALQAGQPRLGDQPALRALPPKEGERRDSQTSVGSPPISQAEADMQRQLSALRKEQVDERFQLERFLDMLEPQPLSSHPPEAAAINPVAPDTTPPVELPDNRPSPKAELLPATVYAPATTPTKTASSPALVVLQPEPSDGNDLASVKRRVQHFIATKGAVPPLNTTVKKMSKTSLSTRHASSMPPSPVIEEERPPAVPLRSPERSRTHSRETSCTMLTHKVSSVSMDDEPRDRSPVSAFSPEGHHRESPPSSSSSSRPHGVDGDSLPTSVVSPLSPFSSIINAAAAGGTVISPVAPRTVSQPCVDRPPESYPHIVELAKSTGPGNIKASKRVSSGVPSPPPTRKSLPRLVTENGADDSGSFLTITSAGEDVLAAWAELGGGSHCLRTKKRVKSVDS